MAFIIISVFDITPNPEKWWIFKVKIKMHSNYYLNEKRPNFSILTLHTNIASASRCVNMWEYVYLYTHTYLCICMHQECQDKFPW